MVVCSFKTNCLYKAEAQQELLQQIHKFSKKKTITTTTTATVESIPC